MKNIYFLFILVISTNSKAQNLITVQNGSSTRFYTQLQTAIDAANSGDTIYVSGGLYPSVTINKTLHIIGTGHNPDSTKESLITTIQGAINFNQGSEYGSLTGLDIQGSLNNSTPHVVSHYFVKRCRIRGGINLSSGCENWNLSENIFQGSIYNNNINNIQNFYFTNNIFEGESPGFPSVGHFSNCFFKNNIFLFSYQCGPYCYYPIYSQNSTFENNIFISSTPATYGTSQSIFKNNLFVENWTPSECGCLGSNNIINQSQSSIFESQSGGVFNYSHNYQLKASCPGKSAGTDGTDVGIYGGSFPWKVGSLPQNPHIQSKSIAGSTDQNGNLKINIKVKAQNN